MPEKAKPAPGMSDSNDFFYIDEHGVKRDAELHETIIREHDYPIVESIMKPIRDKNRAKWLAEQEARRAAERKVSLQKRWQSEKRRAEKHLAKKFNPDQPRDPETGEWTSGGGGGGDGPAAGEPKPVNLESGKKPDKKSPSPHAKDPTSASSLLRIKDITLDEIYARVPKAREQADAALKKLQGSTPTDHRYKLPNGHWAPDRLPTHHAIIERLMPESAVAAATPKAGEQPTLYILGGRGGSGKGWFTDPERGGTLGNVKAVYINNDDVKAELPEWEGWNAGHVHEEASHIGEAMEDYARENRLHTIVDATLKSKTSLAKRIEMYKAAGYRISGHYMYASPDEAATRALSRFVGGNKKDGKGRFVPPEYSLQSLSNEDTFDSHRDDMDHWEVYDNMGDGLPKLHSRKK